MGAEKLQFEHDEAEDPKAVAAMKDILGLLKQDVIRLYDATETEKPIVEAEMDQEIKNLEPHGFYFFGIKRIIPRIVDQMQSETTLSSLYMSHSKSPKII